MTGCTASSDLLLLLAEGALAAASTVAFTFQDPRIAESSGLATSSQGELVYTHNDSGDDARVFAVGPDGRTRTTYVLPGLEPRDWEDMARGPDEQGRSNLWIGDIGDNSARRENGLLVHRVLEPAPTDREQVTTEAPTSFRLRYPDGPGDAESLLVHPRTGRLYVVTKPLAGEARVYAAPEVLDAGGPNLLELVAEATPQGTGTPGGPGIGTLANYLFTAGDIAPDGSRVALRTYTDLYEWAVPGDDLAAAFEGEPTVTPLPPTEQGEGLAYAPDGRSVLLSTEGVSSPVHRVVPPPLPEGEEAPDTADRPDAAEQPGAGAQDRALPSWLAPAGAAAALLALLAVRRARRPRRRRAHRPGGSHARPDGRRRGPRG